MSIRRVAESRALKMMEQYDCGLSIQLAIAITPADREEAMQASHDKLIADAGPRRRSGVEWQIRDISSTQAVLVALGLPLADYIDFLAKAEGHPGGELVIAMCAAREKT
jgi:hypothetical protein